MAIFVKQNHIKSCGYGPWLPPLAEAWFFLVQFCFGLPEISFICRILLWYMCAPFPWPFTSFRVVFFIGNAPLRPVQGVTAASVCSCFLFPTHPYSSFWIWQSSIDVKTWRSTPGLPLIDSKPCVLFLISVSLHSQEIWEIGAQWIIYGASLACKIALSRSVWPPI